MRLALAISLAATAANAGTLGEVFLYDPPQCVTVGADVACLSACALGAALSPELHNYGILGWHMDYERDTMQPSVLSELYQRILMSRAYHGPSYDDLSETSPSLFWIDGEIVNWRDIKDHTVLSSTTALIGCPQ